MKESILKFKVQYSDTDAYKVAWHGSYLRWMEAGRVDLLYLNGVDIKKLDEEEGIVMPVIEVNIKYKKSARLLDEIIVRTNIDKITNLYIVFNQQIEDFRGNIYSIAQVRGLAVKNGKPLRNLTEILNRK